MSNRQVGLLSGRVKKIPATDVSPGRYEWIKLEETEPDLGVPEVDGSILVSTATGIRTWLPFLSPGDGGGITITTELIVGNIKLSGNTISSVDTDGNINLSPNGDGLVIVNAPLDSGPITADSVSATNLTSGRVAIVGTGGKIEDSEFLTFDQTQTIPLLRVQGNFRADDIVQSNISGGQF